MPRRFNMMRALLIALSLLVASIISAQAEQLYRPGELISFAEQFPARESPKAENEEFVRLASLEMRSGLSTPNVQLARLIPSTLAPSGFNCPFLGPTTIGSCIPGTDTTDYLLTSYYGAWSFVSGGTGPNYTFQTSLAGTYGNPQAAYLELCNVPAGTNPTVGALIAGTPNQYFFLGIAYETSVLGTGICSPISQNNFYNVTQGVGYWNPGALAAGAVNGDTLHILSQTASYPVQSWPAAIQVTVPNVTLNIDSGTVISGGALGTAGGGCPNQGVGFCPYAANITVNGGGATIGGFCCGGNDSAVRTQNGATNFSLLGTSSSLRMVLNNSEDCFLGGDFSVGDLTVEHVEMYTCGWSGIGAEGQEHLNYCGADTTGSDALATATYTDDYLHEVVGEGWLYKCRIPIETITDSLMGCLVNGPECDQNGVQDFSCGGTITSSYNTLEFGPYNTNRSWAIKKIGAETVTYGLSGDNAACPTVVQMIGSFTNGAAVLSNITFNPQAYGVSVGDRIADAGGVNGGSVVIPGGITNISSFGGPTSNTVTISNASPANVYWPSHGLIVGEQVPFATTGSLPSPLVPGTWYYVAVVVDANNFTIAASSANGAPQINTTTAGSGTQSVNTYSVTIAENFIASAIGYGLQKVGPVAFTADETGTNCDGSHICNVALSPALGQLYPGLYLYATGIASGCKILSYSGTGPYTIALTGAGTCNTGAGGTGVAVSAHYPLNYASDHEIIIWDGAPGDAAVNDVLCIGAHDAYGNCNSAADPSTAAVQSNSVLVADSDNGQCWAAVIGHCSGATIVLGAGVTDTSNTYCENRAACGYGTFLIQPIPPHLTMADPGPDHDTRVAMAHAAGYCGEGTRSDPLTECPSEAVAANDNLVRVASNDDRIPVEHRAATANDNFYPWQRNGSRGW